MLKRHPELKYAELDRKVMPAYAVTDPYAGSQWHLGKIGAQTAWDSVRGAGVTIAILDSGVDIAHPDLQPNIVPGFNAFSNNTDVTDLCGHGTAVAGAAAGRMNNAIGVAGVAGEARIMPIRVGGDASGGCYAYFSTVASGLTWAADRGARVANLSYVGMGGSSAIISAANYLRSKGGLLFISSGNNNYNDPVAPTTSIITVGATDATDARATFSNYGNALDITAPGTSIWTTSRGGVYQAWQGTSFAAPVASGVAALIIAARPSLTAAQVEAILFASAADLGTAGRDNYFGYGRVNAAEAVRRAVAMVSVADTTIPSAYISSPQASSTVSGQVAVAVQASDNVGVARVELRVNGTTVAIDSAAPYSFSWNSTGVSNGMHNLVAYAFDAAGNVVSSAPVAVNVANTTTQLVVADTTAPVVTIGNPVAGAVSGTVAVSTSATDNKGAAGITQTLRIDNVIVASGSGGSLAYSWNTRKAALGLHTISVTARDAAGNTSSQSVQVTSR